MKLPPTFSRGLIVASFFAPFLASTRATEVEAVENLTTTTTKKTTITVSNRSTNHYDDDDDDEWRERFRVQNCDRTFQCGSNAICRNFRCRCMLGYRANEQNGECQLHTCRTMEEDGDDDDCAQYFAHTHCKYTYSILSWYGRRCTCDAGYSLSFVTQKCYPHNDDNHGDDDDDDRRMMSTFLGVFILLIGVFFCCVICRERRPRFGGAASSTNHRRSMAPRFSGTHVPPPPAIDDHGDHTIDMHVKYLPPPPYSP